MKLKVKLNLLQKLPTLSELLISIAEISNPKQTGTPMDNSSEITGLPSTCDQSTQTLSKEASKEDICFWITRINSVYQYMIYIELSLWTWNACSNYVCNFTSRNRRPKCLVEKSSQILEQFFLFHYFPLSFHHYKGQLHKHSLFLYFKRSQSASLSSLFFFFFSFISLPFQLSRVKYVVRASTCL